MTSNQPAIKGSIVAGHAEVFHKYLAKAQLSEADLLERFEPGDLATLAGPISPVGWYDMRFYRRLLEFLRDHDGEGSNEYLVEAGQRSAENLIRAGIYQQLEYLKRTQHVTATTPEERSGAFGRDLRLLTSITASIMNFTVTEVVADPDHGLRWMIRRSEAIDYPEVLCWTTLGFVNRMAEEHGSRALWRWERPSPDLVLFRMNYDV
jgi:hypothetical protein